ncbi:hypothetical protein BRADI_4g37656v3 [Brachypodium distachyon]|uniref:Uncharacterized protein n=1 Tax=Brachypodium distachyon TaxID=15368 RepID=A0A2K2CSX8_BRADI|nr:hypothetical protein BRADI_4g37656v3 [Brachypodium distachyon]
MATDPSSTAQARADLVLPPQFFSVCTSRSWAHRISSRCFV